MNQRVLLHEVKGEGEPIVLVCLRWTATHSLGEMLVCIQVRKRMTKVTAG